MNFLEIKYFLIYFFFNFISNTKVNGLYLKRSKTYALVLILIHFD